MALALLTAACSSAGQPSVDTEGAQSTAQSETPEESLEEQQEFLEDGVVTRSEYQAAMENAAACVGERGWTVTEVTEVPIGDWLIFNVTYDGELGPAEEARLDTDMSECLITHVEESERVHLGSLAPTGAERDAMLRSLVECLNEAGVEGVSVAMEEEELVGAIVSELPEDEQVNGIMCMDEHAALFRD